MSATTPLRDRAMDAAVVMGRNRENVAVGNEIVRHRLASRLIHWSVALTFFVSLFTGLPIWTPIFGWMATLFGGLSVCRWLHAWAGLAFTVASLVMFFHWVGEMVMTADEKSWIGPKLFEYLRYQGDESQVGKYNGGQKIFFYSAGLGALGLLVSGVVLWFPLRFPQLVRELAILLHDVTFILFVVSIVFHIYLATAAEPGTFGAMTRGTVTRAWAKLHHARWYREVTGEK
ncbi:MAG TPA: formate dehydrogenase subunit gamma [Thermoanaerobaculia bacterium]|nr:formate dehydrogenase subunit gamma [Thermoanaerobaculia bacterium]